MISCSSIIRLLRPIQWIKNLFVFLPMFLNGQINDRDTVIYAGFAFVLFCLISSAVYCINDAVDAPFDALNPDKCNRPVASGAISRSQAVGISCILIGLAACAALGSGLPDFRNLSVVLLIYFVLNITYSLWLKSWPVIDVIIIAVCFLLRIVAGGVACNIHLTLWTLTLVFLLTLMLATGKRRHEAWLCEEKGIESRSNISRYSVRFLNIMLLVLGIASFIIYLIWTFSDYAIYRFHTHILYASSLFVAIGISRYLWILLRKNGGGNPTQLFLQDKCIFGAVICWIAFFYYFLYMA